MAILQGKSFVKMAGHPRGEVCGMTKMFGCANYSSLYENKGHAV